MVSFIINLPPHVVTYGKLFFCIKLRDMQLSRVGWAKAQWQSIVNENSLLAAEKPPFMIETRMAFLSLNFRKQIAARIQHFCDTPSFHVVSALADRGKTAPLKRLSNL